jgi:hypothetical protein
MLTMAEMRATMARLENPALDDELDEHAEALDRLRVRAPVTRAVATRRGNPDHSMAGQYAALGFSAAVYQRLRSSLPTMRTRDFGIELARKNAGRY